MTCCAAPRCPGSRSACTLPWTPRCRRHSAARVRIGWPTQGRRPWMIRAPEPDRPAPGPAPVATVRLRHRIGENRGVLSRGAVAHSLWMRPCRGMSGSPGCPLIGERLYPNRSKARTVRQAVRCWTRTGGVSWNAYAGRWRRCAPPWLRGVPEFAGRRLPPCPGVCGRRHRRGRREPGLRPLRMARGVPGRRLAGPGSRSSGAATDSLRSQLDTRSGPRGVRLSFCLNAEVAVDTVDHNFHPYLHHPKSGPNGSVGRQLHRLDGRLLPQHWSLGRRLACATGPGSDARQDQDIGGGVRWAIRWPRTRVLRQPDRPGPQEAQPLSATRGPRLQGHVYKVTLEPAAWPPFARRAAIRVGQAVVRCTVPGWLSDEYAAFTRRSVSALRRIPRLQRTRRRLTLPHGAVIPQG